MKFRSPLLVILLVVLLVNGYIFYNRSDYSYTNQISLAQLYPNYNSPGLFSNLAGDMLYLQAPVKPGWKYIVDSGDAAIITAKPYIQLREGAHQYTIFDEQQKFSSRILLEKNNSQNTKDAAHVVGIYHIKQSSIDTSAFVALPTPNEGVVTEAERIELQKIVSDSMGIKPGETTRRKIELIGSYLYKKIYSYRGNPADSMHTIPAYRQFKAACSGAKIYCTQFSAIFNMFCSVAGVRSRYIELRGQPYGFSPAEHSVNEYYDNALQQWLAVDMMFNAVGFYRGNLALNLAELKNVPTADSTVYALQVRNDSLVKTYLHQMPVEFHDNLGVDKDIILYHPARHKTSLWHRLIHYLVPNKTFEIYSDVKVYSNMTFAYKQLAFFCLMIIAFIYGLRLLSRFIKNTRAK